MKKLHNPLKRGNFAHYRIDMAEDLIKVSGTKSAKYEGLIPQIKGLVDGESDIVANMANICAALKETFGFFWVGFYMVKEDELVLGPFQGPIACTRIRRGKGVCGTAWETGKIQLVPDVDAFPGHIACSSLSKSEIVIPLFKDQRVHGVLDVDSDQLNDFDEIDSKYLSNLCAWFSEKL